VSIPEAKLAELGIKLPDPVTPAGSYVPAVRTGNYVYCSGQVPFKDGVLLATGTVGADVDIELAGQCARQCGINLIAALKGEIGDLSSVVRIVKLTVFVACTPGFTQQPIVGNGASDLMAAVFGDAGIHARAAIGVASLPLGVPVEVDLIAEVS
jgi:enamine deaminase RidA (YjgF/YER057c/UK114 family)